LSIPNALSAALHPGDPAARHAAAGQDTRLKQPNRPPKKAMLLPGVNTRFLQSC
jgi:hypothetical protein